MNTIRRTTDNIYYQILSFHNLNLETKFERKAWENFARYDATIASLVPQLTH